VAKKCKHCKKELDKEKEILECPTCGYVYCPECVEKEHKDKEEDDFQCLHCDAFLSFLHRDE